MKTSAIFSIIALALTMNLNALTPNPYDRMDSSSSGASFSAFLETDVEEATMEISEWMLDVEAFYFEPAMIEIEDWMLDVDAFEIEPAMEVENWMLDVETFEEFAYRGSYKVDEVLIEDYEETIVMEDWMLDVDAFIPADDSSEENMALKAWMLDVKTFL